MKEHTVAISGRAQVVNAILEAKLSRASDVGRVVQLAGLMHSVGVLSLCLCHSAPSVSWAVSPCSGLRRLHFCRIEMTYGIVAVCSLAALRRLCELVDQRGAGTARLPDQVCAAHC